MAYLCLLGFSIEGSTCKSATEGCPVFSLSKGAKRSSWELGYFSSEGSKLGEFCFSWVVCCSLSSSVLPGTSFHGRIPNTTSYGILFIALCKVMFFLYAASPRTVQHFARLSSLSFKMFKMFSLTLRLIFFPPVLGLMAYEVPPGLA